MGHIFISAAHKSSGKTMVSTGLCRALRTQGLRVQPFKKGPDYIDPMWLGEAAGRVCYNLDFHTQSDDAIKDLFAARAHEADIALIEGNKGLYDGMDVTGTNSNAALAKMLGAPVILVVDTTGITRGVAPLLMGYQVFDKDVNIQGVILNKVLNARHEGKLSRAVEYYTDIPVLGAVRRNAALKVDERHIGLIPSNEHPDARARIDALGVQISDQVDLGRIRTISETAAPLPAFGTTTRAPKANVRIAVAKDAAFGFYYADDLDALRRAGAQLVFFSALNDVFLPTCDALFLGGGFPETQMAKLEANKTLRKRIKAAIENGLPTYGECGGLMYLTRSIAWGERSCEMVGVIPGDTIMHPHPQGRGYVHLKPTPEHPWSSGIEHLGAYIPAHEFHHSTLENVDGPLTFAFDVLRGQGINGKQDGIVMHNMVAGYSHLRDTGHCRWAEPFCAFIRQKKALRKGAPVLSADFEPPVAE